METTNKRIAIQKISKQLISKYEPEVKKMKQMINIFGVAKCQAKSRDFKNRELWKIEMLRDELGEINRFLGRKDYREDNFKISELINELAKEEGKKCGSCDKKIEEDDIVKCQGCKYYFCSNTCWGEGDEDFCQDCLKGDGLMKFNSIA